MIGRRLKFLLAGGGGLCLLASLALAQSANPPDPGGDGSLVIIFQPGQSASEEPGEAPPAPAAMAGGRLAPATQTCSSFGTPRVAADTVPAGGPMLVFGISSTLRATDNHRFAATGARSAILSETCLSFGIESETRLQRLSLSLDSVARAGTRSGLSGIDDPHFRLAYAREGARSRLSLEADYRRSSLEFLDPLRLETTAEVDEPIDETELIRDSGRRTLLGGRVMLETGIDAPLGFVLEARHRARVYSGTTDPDLFDTRDSTLAGTARLRFSPVTEGRLRLSYRDYRADDADDTRRRTRTASLGVSHVLSRTLTLEGNLGLQRIDTDTTADSTHRTAPVGDLRLVRMLPDGWFETGLDVVDTRGGRRITVSLGRTLELPRGQVAASLGATRGIDGRTRAVGDLSWRRDLPAGTISLLLARSVSASAQDNEVASTRIGLDYRHEVSESANILLSSDYVRLRDAGTGQARAGERARLQASYNYAVTRDWALSTGYEYRTRSNAGSPRSTSNTVFMTLRRDFAIRP